MLVETLAQYNEVEQILKIQDTLIVDVETNGLDGHGFNQRCGIGVGLLESSDTFYFPYRHMPFGLVNLPDGQIDYIFSSHCLEHVPDWAGTLLYWTEKLCDGGILFLYLHHYDQKYWRPWNNRKHKHAFVPEVIVDFMEENGYTNIFSSQRDLNHSFIVVGEKH